MKTFLGLLTIVLSKVIILTPKESISNFYNLEYLQKIGDFDDLIIFKTDTELHNEFTLSILNTQFDIEDEQIYRVQKMNFIPWNLDRVSKRNLPLDNTFPYSEKGSCHRNKDIIINTYIVDTGIDENHYEFEGRAKFLENFTDDKENYDGNSHGTHCSGTIGSKTFGLCRDSNLFGVKVLDAEGSGTTSGVISGMNYVFNLHKSQGSNVRSIMSMSLGGGHSIIMNRAIKYMLKNSNTFYMVVASGNENSDACKTSPASAKGVLTVNAMDKHDIRASFSNYGKCSDIYAPGVDIKSTIPGNKSAVYSGTSMATPLVAGLMNHYLDMFPELNMEKLKLKIVQDSTKDTIKSNPKDTNNYLAYLFR